MKRRIGCILLAILLALSSAAFAHSGNTDKYGGHRDNQNKSGLGPYHYHCGGYGPHLHPDGVCPYTGKKVSNPNYPSAAPRSSSGSSSGSSSSGSSSNKSTTAIFGASKSDLQTLYTQGGLVLGKTTGSSVNVRKETKTDSKRLDKIEKKGTVVVVLETIKSGGEASWYKIRIDSKTTGYVSAKFISLIDTAAYIKDLK